MHIAASTPEYVLLLYIYWYTISISNNRYLFKNYKLLQTVLETSVHPGGQMSLSMDTRRALSPMATDKSKHIYRRNYLVTNEYKFIRETFRFTIFYGCVFVTSELRTFLFTFYCFIFKEQYLRDWC